MKKAYLLLVFVLITITTFGQEDCNFSYSQIASNGDTIAACKLVKVAVSPLLSAKSIQMSFRYKKQSSDFYLELDYFAKDLNELRVDSGSKLVLTLKNDSIITLYSLYNDESRTNINPGSYDISTHKSSPGSHYTELNVTYKITRQQLEMIRDYKLKTIQMFAYPSWYSIVINASKGKRRVQKHQKAVECILNHTFTN